MRMRALAYLRFAALVTGSASGQQTAVAKPKFEVADVHVSERSGGAQESADAGWVSQR